METSLGHNVQVKPSKEGANPNVSAMYVPGRFLKQSLTTCGPCRPVKRSDESAVSGAATMGGL